MDDPTRFRNLPSQPEPVNGPKAPNLADLWQTIRETYSHAEHLGRQTVEAVHRVGALLIAAKRQTDHGEWQPRLRAAGVAPRTAARFMRIAERYTADQVREFRSVYAAERALAAPTSGAKPYRPTGPVMDSAAADRLIEQYRAAGDPDDVAERGLIAQHVLQTGRAPSAAWFDDNPCSYCDCFPAGSTTHDQVDAWRAGRGPDPWKCPKGDRRWRCEAAGDAADSKGQTVADA